MKKLLLAAFMVCMIFLTGISSAENIEAWNLNDMITPQLKEDFVNMSNMEITAETLADVRKIFTARINALPKDKAVKVYNEMISPNLRVRVYVPDVNSEELPALLWIHGGGHILGVPEQDELLLLEIAKEAKCIIAAPDYRLAPEYPYPADIDDCFEALKWLTDKDKSKLPVRKDKVAVAGQSAGGGLTAALALRARDENGPALCFQMPLYPMLDCRTITPSSNQITDYRVWNRDFNITAWKMYLGDVKAEEVSQYASPAFAKDLTNLPPTYTMVGSLDPFRDETINYVQRLLQAGVPVEFHIVPGVFHGFEGILMNSQISIQARNEYIQALANALK